MAAGPNEKTLALGPPPRWLRCPRKGQIIENKFLPFKAPLCTAYDEQVEEMYRFPPKMVFQGFTSEKQKIGLWMDLTKTERFYTSAEVELEGARYVKLQCAGHDESPTPDNVNTFVQLCKDFWRQPGNRGKIVAVHCTHGFNRTGFLIAAYLHLVHDWEIGAAVKRFAEARPPGIYKQEYIQDLFTRYGDPEDPVPAAPSLPSWSNEDSLHLTEEETAGGAATVKNVPFFDGHVPAVRVVEDSVKRPRLQRKVQEICHWKRQGFPGGQPVSMDQQNVKFVAEKPYKVSWKADGVRYMMLISGQGEVHMFDRDNTPYAVPDLIFPHRKEQRHIEQTLIDGEMVLDVVEGRNIPRYLIYDIITFENQPIGACDFNRRLLCIEKEIIGPRLEAKKRGTVDPSREPFSVRAKPFWDASPESVEKVLNPEFSRSVGHETDGLIFQPVETPYFCGRTDNVLKWKPPHLNSVDFKLRLRREQGVGMLPEWKGDLFVLHLDTPFGQIGKVTKELKPLDGKIIECTYDRTKNGWVFLRERVDKSFPNAYTTAKGVCDSILNPVTQEYLIKLIKESKRQGVGMEPPKKLPMKRPLNGSLPPPKDVKAPPPPYIPPSSLPNR